MGNQIAMIRGMLTTTNASLRRAMGTDTLSVTRVRAFTPATRADSNAKTMYLRLATAGIDSAAIAEAGEQLKASTCSSTGSFDPRGLPHDRAGSADVTGPDARGTARTSPASSAPSRWRTAGRARAASPRASASWRSAPSPTATSATTRSRAPSATPPTTARR